MRIAIVGLGPKGLFALERLLHHASGGSEHARIDIDAFEPHAYPGAGPVYSPDQPSYLRMNFRAEQVNLWPAGARAVPVAEQRSFVQWRGPDGDPYPPRAQVGKYLIDGLDRLRRHAPAHVRVKLIAEKVVGLHRDYRDWTVTTAHAGRDYDHVLICTGHEPISDDALACSWHESTPLIAGVFPTTKLGTDRIGAGSTVAARGFALSFIDAALALTEGRGGRFEPASATTLRYVHGESDVGVLLPYSRTGRPMLAKPAQLESSAPLAAAGGDACLRIAELPNGFSLAKDLLPAIAAVAEAATEADRGLIAAALDDASGGVPPRTDLSPGEEMQRSVEIALGEREPDLLSALGSAWRAVYPALVARLGGDGLDASQWPAFRRLSTSMERLAFGPSPENVMKLLALIEAGRVDLSCLDAPDWRSIGQADIVLDTVIAAPGALGTQSPLFEQLIAGGHARILGHQRGLDVRSDGACIGQDGTVTQGLSAIGRPTEDSVIGNDTLNRALHPAADLWARGVLQARPSVVVAEPVR